MAEDQVVFTASRSEALQIQALLRALSRLSVSGDLTAHLVPGMGLCLGLAAGSGRASVPRAAAVVEGGNHITVTEDPPGTWTVDHDALGDVDGDNDAGLLNSLGLAQSQEQVCTGTTVTLSVGRATLQFDSLGHRAGAIAEDDDDIVFVIPDVLNDLADVDASPSAGDVLTWDGEKWIADALPEAPDPPDPDAEDPGTSIDTLGDDTEGSDEKATDTWTSGGTNGLALWVTCRVVYNEAPGDEKLYEFRRKLTFDKSGRLYSVSGETDPIEVDAPDDC
jgi:hypothetical protein